jgi:hypothetical protein
LFVWEEELVHTLLDLINSVTLWEVEDGWGWKPENGDSFTVKSTFFLVSDLSVPNMLVPPLHASSFTAIWKCPAPSKVSAFAWQLLHDRVPTRGNLVRRRIIDTVGDNSCVLCGECMESSLHLFLYCQVATKVWVGVFKWLDLPFTLPHNLFSILNYFNSIGGKKLRKGLRMIWNAVVWSLWRHRNAVLFENGNINSVEVLEAVKVLSWKWWLSQLMTVHPLYYEWSVQPNLCIAT